jgi:hypothetical protein
MFQYERQARICLEELKARLGKFGLEVASDKTRILPFGRFEGTKASFDFLGFTFRNVKTQGGKYMLGVRTSKSRLKGKKEAVKRWLKTRLTKPLAETMKSIRVALKGHCNYYGVDGNARMLMNFHDYIRHTYHRMLNRRDQKGRFCRDKFLRIWNFYVDKPQATVRIWNWKPMLA